MGRKDASPGGWLGWIKGCGCVVAGLLTVLALIGGWMATMGPLLEAIQTREILDQHYGPQEGFTPAPDGAVPAARMEAFLAVRERLAEPCSRLAESSAAIDSVEHFEWIEHPPERNPFEALWEGGLDALGLETRRGQFLRARNEALLEARMGLGEYTYIFVIGYTSHLVPDREVESLVAVEGGVVLSRVRRLLVETLRRQLAAVEAEPPGAASTAWARELASEIARLEEDPRRIPWMDGLPPQIETSIAPYRERLDALLCQGALTLELLRNEKKGLSIHSH